MKRAAGKRTASSPKGRNGSNKEAAARAQKKPVVTKKKDGHWIIDKDFNRLQERLREAQETLEAIRSGSVDAVVVSGENGDQIYSLAGAEQPYRVYLERMQEGAVTVSTEGLILYCNERFAEMVELPLERVISSDLRDHLRPNAWKELQKVFAPGDQVIKHETSLHCKEDKMVPVHLTASQLPLEGQNVMCLVVTDLTAQKAQEEMRVAKELAEKANLAKDGFLARLSHELRTPLTPVLLAIVDLEEDESLAPEIRQQMSMVRRNIELEARLIDDLLDLTRIASGKLEFHAAPLDLHVVLDRAVEICRPEIEAKRIAVHLRIEAEKSVIRGDGVRIQQVFWNLIRNAAKFTPAGGTITIRSGNAGSGKVWVKVEDTGIGFAPEQASHLFAAFEQGGRQITQRFGGLGLGLAISQSIISGHQGHIRAESRGPGTGATFTVEFPIPDAEPLDRRGDHDSEDDAAKAHPIRILLVEDHDDTRLNMKILLQRRKHKVQAADCGTQAIQLASKQSFDLVVSDLGLPDMSGLEMMRTLRARFGLRGIAISGFGMDEDVALAKEAGFVQHLTKPVRFERLLKAIDEVGVPA